VSPEFPLFRAGNSHRKGRLSTDDLLVITSLDQLLLKLQILLKFFYKTSYLNEVVNCTEPFTVQSLPLSKCSPLSRIPKWGGGHLCNLKIDQVMDENV
jgi:hypothetical protein